MFAKGLEEARRAALEHGFDFEGAHVVELGAGRYTVHATARKPALEDVDDGAWPIPELG